MFCGDVSVTMSCCVTSHFHILSFQSAACLLHPSIWETVTVFTPRRDHQGKVFLLLKPVEKCIKYSKNGDVGIRFSAHVAISQRHGTNHYKFWL